MRFIVKFGKTVVPHIDFPDNRSARAWAEACYPLRHGCCVMGIKA